MLNECIIVLGANQFQRERALIGAEKTHAQVVTVSPNAPFHNNKYPSLTILSQETHPEQLLKDVVGFIQKTHLELRAIIPLNDFVLNAGLAVARHFNLPYNEKNTIENCRHKDKMKAILAEANLPIIKSHPFSSVEEAAELASVLGYPVVVKPLNFGGSGGVKKANSIEELKEAITETKAHLLQHAKHYDSDPAQMVMESYVHKDREVSVEVMNTPEFSQVIGITEKYLGEEPYFSEIAHIVPSMLCEQETQSREIGKLAINVCRALNIKFGMAHVEIKLSEDGLDPVVIEVGARPAGDGIMDLYEKSTGVNIYELHCKAYLGCLEKAALPNRFLRSSAIAYLHPEPGVIDSINCQKLNEMDLQYVDLVAIKATQGQEVAIAKNWSTRYGFAEYTFWGRIPSGFNVVKNTKRMANKIFSIKEK